jgi:hypothetical protein
MSVFLDKRRCVARAATRNGRSDISEMIFRAPDKIEDTPLPRRSLATSIQGRCCGSDRAIPAISISRDATTMVNVLWHSCATCATGTSQIGRRRVKPCRALPSISDVSLFLVFQASRGLFVLKGRECC